MKTLHNILFSFLILLALSLQRCDEPTELEKLPPATQTGQYTFGCLVNGKAWVIRKMDDAPTVYQNGTFDIYAGVSNSNFNSIMEMHVYDLNLNERTYQLSEVSQTAPSDWARYYDNKTPCEYFTTSTYTGTLTITHLDKVNYIVSGTFEFEVWSADCSEVIKVTDGRFDQHYFP